MRILFIFICYLVCILIKCPRPRPKRIIYYGGKCGKNNIINPFRICRKGLACRKDTSGLRKTKGILYCLQPIILKSNRRKNNKYCSCQS